MVHAGKDLSIKTCSDCDPPTGHSYLVHTTHDGPHGGVARSIHSLAVVGRAPRCAVDVDLVRLVAHRVGLDQICHVRLVQHAQSCNVQHATIVSLHFSVPTKWPHRKWIQKAWNNVSSTHVVKRLRLSLLQTVRTFVPPLGHSPFAQL